MIKRFELLKYWILKNIDILICNIPETVCMSNNGFISIYIILLYVYILYKMPLFLCKDFMKDIDIRSIMPGKIIEFIWRTRLIMVLYSYNKIIMNNNTI